MNANKREFRFRLTPLMFYGGLALIMLVCGVVTTIYWIYFYPSVRAMTENLPPPPIEQHKYLLKSFATFTVEVAYTDKAVKSKFNQDENFLSELALKKVSADVEKEFGDEIKGSRFGNPYSFQTNPLNLAITFEIEQCERNKNLLCIKSLFKRTTYLSVYNLPDDPRMQSHHLEWIKFGTDKFVQYLKFVELHEKRTGEVMSFGNLDEFTKRIDFLSEVIVEDMVPEEKEAAAAEAELRQEIKNSEHP